MSDSSNNLAGKLRIQPYPELAKLEPLLGRWQVEVDFVNGIVEFEWLDGTYFMVQHVDVAHELHSIKGIEYIGYDKHTQTLRSNYIDNHTKSSLA